ncbi:tigger transposable element-derived protein 4 [Acipenser ruthenus]|nr:tigger transposable element-derived protein 4 [Acipenser ruthenus]
MSETVVDSYPLHQNISGVAPKSPLSLPEHLIPGTPNDSLTQPENVLGDGQMDKSPLPVIRKKKSLSIEEKVDIISAVESGRKKTDVAAEYGIKKNSLSSIIKNKDKILDAYESFRFDPSRKRLRTATYTDLEEALMRWYQISCCLNVPVNGPMLRVKANDFAQKLGYKDFKCSNGWLDRFKSRYGLVFRSQPVEASSTPVDTSAVWYQTVLPYYLNEYQPKNVFSVAETGLLYQMLPTNTFAFRGETCSFGKQSRKILTVVVGANVDGTEKLPLLVIGKSANPCSFKSVKSLPVDYESNSKAGLTAEVFEKWVRKIDERFQAQQRRVALFVCQSPSYPELKNLKAIELLYLPSTAMPNEHPMKQGTIKSLKVKYRHQLIKRFVECVEKSKEYTLSLLDTVDMLHLCWRNVTRETVAYSYNMARFKPQNHAAGVEDVSMEEENRHNLIEQARAVGVEFLEGLSLDQYTELDEDLMALDPTVLSVESPGRSEGTSEEALSLGNEEEEDEDEYLGSEMITPSKTETLAALAIVKRFLRAQEVNYGLHNSVADIENFIQSDPSN